MVSSSTRSTTGPPAVKEPAREFINSLDLSARMRVFVQIDKLKKGNPGQGHGVGKVNELVIDVGPGFRVYYALVDKLTLILLLTAGDKHPAGGYQECKGVLARSPHERKESRDGKGREGEGKGSCERERSKAWQKIKLVLSALALPNI